MLSGRRAATDEKRHVVITPPFDSANAKRPKQEILCIDLDQCDDRGRKCHDGQIDTATAQEAFADRLDRRISEILRGEEKTAEAETGPLTLAFRRPVIRHHAKLLRATLTALPILVAGVADAGPFEDATAAYERGDYATALRLISTLAEQGAGDAQFNLGSCTIKARANRRTTLRQ